MREAEIHRGKRWGRREERLAASIVVTGYGLAQGWVAEGEKKDEEEKRNGEGEVRFFFSCIIYYLTGLLNYDSLGLFIFKIVYDQPIRSLLAVNFFEIATNMIFSHNLRHKLDDQIILSVFSRKLVLVVYILLWCPFKTFDDHYLHILLCASLGINFPW